MFGAVSSPSHKVGGYSSPIVALRKQLDLYANIRPVVPAKGKTLAPGEKFIDTIIVRENTEDLYVNQETLDESAQGQVASAIHQVSAYASSCIVRKAFQNARGRVELRAKAGEQAQAKVTVYHKVGQASP